MIHVRHWSDALADMSACGEGVEWARTQPAYATAWATCQRGDWMLWILGKLDKSAPWSKERKPLVRCAVACAAGVLECLPVGDGRDATEICLSVVQAWCEGAATREDVCDAADADNAADDAYAAASAAASAYAASDAAYAAYVAADVAYAAAASAYAASDAAYAVDAAYVAADVADASSAAAYAARERSLAASAAIVRSHYPTGPVLS